MRFASLLKRLKRGKKLKVVGVQLKLLVLHPLPVNRDTNLPLAGVLVRAMDPPMDCVGEMWLHGGVRSRLLNLKLKIKARSQWKAIPTVPSRRRSLSRCSLLLFAMGGVTW